MLTTKEPRGPLFGIATQTQTQYGRLGEDTVERFVGRYKGGCSAGREKGFLMSEQRERGGVNG